MAKKRKTTAGFWDINSNSANAMATDTHTSQLPDLVVYQILQTLPTKLAVQASILSKQWARVWSLFPVSDFDYDTDSDSNRRSFFKFLRMCLERHEKYKYDLDKFRLCMKYLGGAGIIDKWLNLVAERNVKELDINLSTPWKGSSVSGKYYIPQTVLNVTSLTTLNLESVRIKDNISSISLPSLKSLSLKYMELGEEGSVCLISGCPSIESLSFVSCVLWENAKVSSLSLQSLEVIQCMQYSAFKRRSSRVRIRVEAINLESFRYRGKAYYMLEKGDVDIFSCQKLKNLEYSNTHFLGQWLEDEVIKSRFPLLESLMLDNINKNFVYDRGMINIDSPHLQRLVFSGVSVFHIENVKINTPNLLSFAFTIDSLYSRNFSKLLSDFSLNAPNLSEATINFNISFAGNEFPSLINFLENFDCSGKLSLSFNHAETLIFPEEMRRTLPSPLPSLKHLKVVIYSSMEGKDSVLRHALQWIAPALESLQINETVIRTK